MASLYQRSSPLASRSTASCGSTFTRSPPLCMAAQQQSGIVGRVDTQPDAAPFERMTFAGDQVLHRAHAPARLGGADLQVAEMEPELARPVAGERDRHRHRVVARNRLLD